MPGYRTTDLAKAKALVKELGGLKTQLGTINVLVAKQTTQALASQWAQAGIKTQIKSYDLGPLIQAFQSKKWTAMLQTAGSYDPAAGVGVAFRYASQSPFSGVKDKKLDALLGQASGTLDEGQRKSLYDQAAKYMNDEAYSPFLFAFAPASVAVEGRDRAWPHHGADVRRGHAEHPLRRGLDGRWRRGVTDQAVRPGPALALRSPALRLIGNRLATAIPVLWGVTFLTFAVIQLLPGDAAQQLLGINATPEQLQEFRDKLNLDDPFLVRYFHWLGGVLTGDLGHSLASDQPVTSILSDGLPTTFELLLYALVISLALTVPIALLAARNPGGFVDRVGMVVSMAGLSVANYVLAVVLVYVFAVQARLAAGDLHEQHRHAGGAHQVAHAAGALDRLPALLLLHAAAARGHPRADAGRGLRRHREGEGRRALARARPPRAAQLALRAADDRGAQPGNADRRDGDHRADLRRARDRPLAAGGDQQPRRAGGRGDRARPRRRRRRSPNLLADVLYAVLDPRIRYGRPAA